jgi:hypothetical protein
MRITGLLLMLTVGMLWSAPARAQEVEPPRVEFGAVASALAVVPVVADGTLGLLGGGPTVTLGLTRRIRLDLRAELLGPRENSGLYGVYGAQVRFPLRQSPDGARSLALTAGVGGLFSFYRSREFRSTRPDGSTVVYPGYRDMRVSGPRLVTVGIAHQRRVSRRAAVVFGADAIVGQGALVVRGTVGVSFGMWRP